MRVTPQCDGFEDRAMLYAAEELEAQDRAIVEEHARECSACAATLANEMELRAVVSACVEAAEDADPSGLLLAECRSELAETLDDQEAEQAAPGWRERWSPARWMGEFRRALTFHPGWSAAALLLVGALGSTAARDWYRQTSLLLPGRPAMTVSAAPPLSDRQLETMGVEGVRFDPQPGTDTPEVEVQVTSKQPVVVQGTPDDAEVQRVLTYVVEHGDKFNPGVRLDSLEVLRTRVADPQVRAALCAAARHDENPAVRLKALEALNGSGGDPAVQQTILGALAGDDNSGVRIQAVNALVAALGDAATPAMPMPPNAVEVLRDRERNDPNGYVRSRSAGVLSRLVSADTDAGPRP